VGSYERERVAFSVALRAGESTPLASAAVLHFSFLKIFMEMRAGYALLHAFFSPVRTPAGFFFTSRRPSADFERR